MQLILPSYVCATSVYFVYRKLVLRRAEIYFVLGGVAWQEISALEAGKKNTFLPL